MAETPSTHESMVETSLSEDDGAGAVSLKNFASTPFSAAEWEIVSAIECASGFNPLELDIITEAQSAGDPLFEDFAAERTDETQFWHGPQGSKPSASAVDSSLEKQVEALKAKAAKSFEEGRVQGAAEGRAAAEQDAEAKIDEAKARIESLCKSLPEQTQVFYKNVEHEAVQLALKIAKKIIGTTVDLKPDYIVDVVRRAMESLGAAEPMRVRVSYQDLEFIQIVGLPPELSAEELGIEYVGDESITSGCVVETNFGEIDLQLEHMWEKVRSELAEICK